MRGEWSKGFVWGFVTWKELTSGEVPGEGSRGRPLAVCVWGGGRASDPGTACFRKTLTVT